MSDRRLIAPRSWRTAQIFGVGVEETTDRRGVVTWAELEVPDEPRRGIVTWAELEVPNAPRRGIVTWAELEVPNEPRRGIVTWAEFETPDEPRRGIVTWAELEVPDVLSTDRRGVITWAEFEVPNEPRRGVFTWAELEIPDEPRRAIVTWAELEVPDVIEAEIVLPGGGRGKRRHPRYEHLDVLLDENGKIVRLAPQPARAMSKPERGRKIKVRVRKTVGKPSENDVSHVLQLVLLMEEIWD